MIQGFGLRTLTAIAIVAVAAIVVFLLDQDIQVTLVTLIGGAAAVLVAAGTTEAEAAAAESAPLALADTSEARIGEVLEAIVEPILIVTDGRVTQANAAARALLGGHIGGQHVRLAIRHPAAAERLVGPLEDGSDAPIDLVGLGTLDQRWQMRVRPILNADHEGQRIVHLVDQTGSYAAERMRVDFVANASHELRTPLASILGYIETLRDDAGDEPDIRARFLKIMDDEARRMQRLVEDLISLSRIEAEKYRLPAHAVDLADLIAEVRAEIIQGPVDLDVGVDVPPVVGDRVQLSQMLHNLIGNGIKYGHVGKPVTVKLWHDAGGMVRLSVADQGDGIAPEHLPRLTERFYRVDPGRSRAIGGTGLGLAIVKHIVERHRGRLDIASVVGTGTTVSILLPAQAASEKQSPSLS